jgi:hypothetical protein
MLFLGVIRRLAQALKTTMAPLMAELDDPE